MAELVIKLSAAQKAALLSEMGEWFNQIDALLVKQETLKAAGSDDSECRHGLVCLCYRFIDHGVSVRNASKALNRPNPTGLATYYRIARQWQAFESDDPERKSKAVPPPIIEGWEESVKQFSKKSLVDYIKSFTPKTDPTDLELALQAVQAVARRLNRLTSGEVSKNVNGKARVIPAFKAWDAMLSVHNAGTTQGLAIVFISPDVTGDGSTPDLSETGDWFAAPAPEPAETMEPAAVPAGVSEE